MGQISVTFAYMWAFVILVGCFLGAVISANLILFKPNNPGTTARKIWFWSLFVATGLLCFLVNFLISQSIDIASRQSDYHMHTAIATVAAMCLYFVIGWMVSKIFSKSKVGTWF